MKPRKTLADQYTQLYEICLNMHGEYTAYKQHNEVYRKYAYFVDYS